MIWPCHAHCNEHEGKKCANQRTRLFAGIRLHVCQMKFRLHPLSSILPMASRSISSALTERLLSSHSAIRRRNHHRTGTFPYFIFLCTLYKGGLHLTPTCSSAHSRNCRGCHRQTQAVNAKLRTAERCRKQSRFEYRQWTPTWNTHTPIFRCCSYSSTSIH